MRSARISLFHGSNQPFEIYECGLGPSDAGEVLVRVNLATICGSDLHTFAGRRTSPIPCILGHEAVGQVAESTNTTDFNGSPLKEGDRITWSIISSCGTCLNCAYYQLPQKCETLLKYGHAQRALPRDLNGGFAQYIRLQPGTAIFRLPDSMADSESVSLNCALSTVIAGLNGIDIGDSVVIQGCGMLGIYATSFLRYYGCEVVIVVDVRSDRLEMAKNFGATHTFNLTEVSTDQINDELLFLTNQRGVDLVVEVSGVASAFTDSLDWLRIGGHYLTLGYVYPHAKTIVPMDKIVRKCLTIYGSHNYHPRFLGDAIEFVRETRHQYSFDLLVGNTYPLTEIDQAFRQAIQGNQIRVGLCPWE
jgi:alcohol dehydrogenase|tara:strand:- start:5049 stop:6134 length:1086 start_codon:yes stop_codon:yes gene_type:complete